PIARMASCRAGGHCLLYWRDIPESSCFWRHERLMLARDMLRQIRRLQLRARRAVEDLLGGEYHSVFKGMGIAFEEVREYQPGDDVRTIDWNVTARMGHPFIKRFIEERELTVILLVDCSASQAFGTLYQQKRELAA